MCKLFLNKKAFVFTAFALFSLVFIQLNSADANPKVLMETSKGDITIELYEKEAPITVKNFLSYVSDGFYNNLIFHRVIPNFMIQGGGFDSEMNQKPVKAPIKNEARRGLNNKRGTLAMARTNVINSATGQFFINLKSNDFLNHKDNSSSGFGYAVFGEVVEGMDVVDSIGKTRTHAFGMFRDVPIDHLFIKNMSVIEE
ncbi:MAG: peptidyl-prolyl cis-trans isomerase [Candidatus Scalindua sp.]|jgi:cyclophilin family peptidyl-prolyl cis-trans isomerase|nr:peptidyl-prolyl cis-trans isomerase [Candidatus Scalindua sp.]MBT5303598.1 peptidyl-prolyl cis-trans isomerase [Candidatus Scalindua sp.]MBT6046731.1 peptidyl-prolyl cis-trans isomerase [Candidatus Scalindua sp.]MBT6227959.1 peptidyl-prolyl cis-trans isomerase [Candidatus Scalindua sp.]MBT6564244.1 peptidyl-prolyl cis-trans isomerase [Candidatus Scalindua sp.]